MNHRCEESESKLAFVDRLSNIVTRLISVADRIPINNRARMPYLADIDPTSQEALEIRNERLQLVEAWRALEAEQRQQLLEQTTAPLRPTSATQETRSASATTEQVKNSPNSLDHATQFRLLQRECDRPRS